MENETEVIDTPVDNDEVLTFDPNDFVEEDEDVTVEDTTEPTTEEVDTPVETKAEELDYTPFLKDLSGKIKYQDENINIENVDDIITNYQKGKNYDKLQDKLKNLENSEELQYIKELAKQNGMTSKEFIKAVKENQVAQEKQAEEERLNKMIDSGVPEDVAKEVIETAKLRKKLAEDELKMKQEKDKQNEEQKKQKEYDDFLTAFPDINIKEIPKEVFENATKSNLKFAYTDYMLKQTQSELERVKQESKIKAPIKSATTHGEVVVEKIDPFLKGLGLQ